MRKKTSLNIEKVCVLRVFEMYHIAKERLVKLSILLEKRAKENTRSNKRNTIRCRNIKQAFFYLISSGDQIKEHEIK